MFSDRWQGQNTDPIKIGNVSYADFKSFLSYFYGAQKFLTNENIFAILDLAEMYDVSTLKNECDFSKIQFSIKNVIKFCEAMVLYKVDAIKKPLEKYVVNNFLSILDEEEFSNAKREVIEVILSFDRNYM